MTYLAAIGATKKESLEIGPLWYYASSCYFSTNDTDRSFLQFFADLCNDIAHLKLIDLSRLKRAIELAGE